MIRKARRAPRRKRRTHGLPAIPWHDVYGLRNRVVHDDGAVDFHIVFTALTRDIPGLLKELSDGTP